VVILGSHLSIAGGAHRAAERAADYGFEAVGIFVRNQLRWSAPPLTDEAVATFRRARRKAGLRAVVAHGSYLANLAGAPTVRKRSIAAVADELDRTGRLGAEFHVLHPGSPGEDGRDVGIERVAEALNGILAECPRRRVKLLLESTAGTGHQLGGAFEDLAEILARLDRPRRFGVCLDTCHAFAAGYDLRSPKAYADTMRRFDDIIGLDRLMAIHLNDSVGPLGCRRDRHAHIGKGKIGRRGFANLVRDPRLTNIPMILETPKQRPPGTDWDAVNARLLRKLAGTA